jgi:pantoate--beta-alanine ligase
MASLVREVLEMRQISESLRSSGKRIAIVPTMGALHEGHLSLIRIARENADVVLTTIFVNPAQFGPKEDFNSYPRDLDRDIDLASSAGTEYIFAPSAEEMYPRGFLTMVEVDGLGDILEGESRPGHFRGVSTVVMKLFNITRPHLAVFGQKDAQQVSVIRKMVEDLNADVRIIVGPIIREADGLAMSSRNVYLSARQRREAPVLYRSLQLADRLVQQGDVDARGIIARMKELISSESAALIDYISIADNNTLQPVDRIEPQAAILISLAARFGSTRLIDNLVALRSG